MVKLFSKNSNVCDHNPESTNCPDQRHRRTDGQTDQSDQTTCVRKTALCTKVHRAVKTNVKTSTQNTML